MLFGKKQKIFEMNQVFSWCHKYCWIILLPITIASQAAVGGPGSALALSMSMKWPSLVPPGIIVGIFGYAIGNYVGFACAYVTRALLG